MKIFSYTKGVICTFLLLISNTVFADWVDISSNIEITKSRPAFDRVNRVYFVHLDVKNTGTSTLSSPFRLLIDNSTIPVTRQSGNTETGVPFVDITNESITANETVRVRVDFLAQRKALTFDVALQSEVLLLEGRFIDSSVSGIEYLTSSGHSGFTGINGEFIFEPGDRVEFFLGGHSIGSSNGKSIITPVDLFSDVIDKNDKHNKVASLAVLLQSVDEDQNPSNGIVISTDMYNEAKNLEKEITTFVDVNEEEQIGVLAKMGVPYISKGTAIGHLNSTLQEYDIDETCYHSEDSYYFGTFTTPAKYCKARTRRYNFYYKDIPILNGLSTYHYNVAAGAAASGEDALRASATMIDSILYAQITTDATYLRLADKKARKNYIKKKAKGWIQTAIQKSLTTTGNLILNDQVEEAILSYSVTMIGDYLDAPSCISGDKSACIGILFNQLRNGFDFFVASFGSIIIDNHLEKGNEYTIVKEMMTQYYNYHQSWEKYAQKHCSSSNERDSQVCNIDFITEDRPLPDGWEDIIIHVASKSGMCGNEHGCEKNYDFSVTEVSNIFVERLEFLRTIEDIPLLTTPQSLSIEVSNDSLNLEWDNVNSAISYIVSWKIGANFSSTHIERNINNTSFILNRELIENDEKVYFQVQAIGEEGDISELSETIVFDSLLGDVTKLEDFLTDIVILDSNFMTCITDSIDKYNWKSILDVKQLSCAGYGIENLVGIESFPNLTTINFDNNNIKSTPLSENKKLVSVSFVNNPLVQYSINYLVRQYYPYLLLSNEMDVSVNITVVGITDSIKLRIKSDYEEVTLEINTDGQYSTGKVFRKYSYWNADINWEAELVRTPDNHNCEFDTELGQFLTEITEITITCSVQNQAPIANAGNDLFIAVGEPVNLDASGSTDNGVIEKYEWLKYGNVISESSTFVLADLPVDVHDFMLRVTDNLGEQDTDTINVIVYDNQSDADYDGMPDVWEIANALDPLVDDSLLDDDIGGGDGRSNLQEYLDGTDPNSYDEYNPTPDIERGLIAYYPFDGDANDYSPNGGHDGDPNGSATFIEGNNSHVLSLDGSGYASSEVSPILSTQITMSAWVNPRSQSYDNYTNGGIILNGGDYEIAITANTNTIRYALTNVTNTPFWVDTGIPVFLNEWSHIVVSYDGAKIITYLNGSEVHRGDYSGAMPSTTYPLGIGGRFLTQGGSVPNDGWYSLFNGEVDEVKIYSRAITNDEVTMLHDLNAAKSTIPQNFSISKESDNTVVTWDNVYGAFGYMVHISEFSRYDEYPMYPSSGDPYQMVEVFENKIQISDFTDAERVYITVEAMAYSPEIAVSDEFEVILVNDIPSTTCPLNISTSGLTNFSNRSSAPRIQISGNVNMHYSYSNIDNQLDTYGYAVESHQMEMAVENFNVIGGPFSRTDEFPSENLIKVQFSKYTHNNYGYIETEYSGFMSMDLTLNKNGSTYQTNLTLRLNEYTIDELSYALLINAFKSKDVSTFFDIFNSHLEDDSITRLNYIEGTNWQGYLTQFEIDSENCN